jgi:hypothetical protein
MATRKGLGLNIGLTSEKFPSKKICRDVEAIIFADRVGKNNQEREKKRGRKPVGFLPLSFDPLRIN